MRGLRRRGNVVSAESAEVLDGIGRFYRFGLVLSVLSGIGVSFIIE